MSKVIYASSYDRGLVTLLELWPDIKKQVPDCELNVFYGWNSFDMVHKKNPEQMKWKWNVIRQFNNLKDLGVTEHGRISHQELADKFKEADVWAYPTEFTEIHCITALKAQEAGCIPVTTGCYALKETVVNNKYTIECEDIASNVTKRQEFIDAMVGALQDKDYKIEPVEGAYWSEVAKTWDKALA